MRFFNEIFDMHPTVAEFGAVIVTQALLSFYKSAIIIQVITIDNTVGDEKIGFIKMDIEGVEFDALHGAKKVIVRDKPLFAIMDYLHQLVPEYCFWIRHCSLRVD